MPRILCVWLPLWPIQRFRSARPEVKRRALALYETTSRGERLTVCSPLALRQGLRPGMSRAEAEILAGDPHRTQKQDGDVVLLPAEPQVDRDALHQLALRCRERFSPLTAVEETDHPECLFLEIDGCGHLFGGERGLVRAVVQFFRDHDWRLRGALAGTAGAAWGIAHHARRSIVLIPEEETEASLQPLPVAALRLPASAVQTLSELGIHRIGQLIALPRAELASRFEPIVLQRLRQALGIEPELLVPVHEPEPIRARWDSEDAVSDRAALELLCGQLFEDVLHVCRNRGLALLQCECRLDGTDRRPETCVVELVRPSDQADHILKLLVLQWERRAIPEAVHAILIEVTRTTVRTASSGTLFDDGRLQTDRKAAGRLIERLTSRLGKAAVLRASLFPDAQPEYALKWQPWGEEPPKSAASPRRPPGWEPTPPLPWERPLTLLPPASVTVWSVVPDGPPQRVQWRQQMRSVVRCWGPERIETGWWRGRQCHRDYYRVELETGEWLWIFRNAEGGWSLHGVFD